MYRKLNGNTKIAQIVVSAKWFWIRVLRVILKDESTRTQLIRIWSNIYMSYLIFVSGKSIRLK